LDDFDNSCSAYEKAIELTKGEDVLMFINYAITLYTNDEVEKAKVQFAKFESIYLSLPNASDVDPEVPIQANLLRNLLR
jgi:Bardet-Biedl syndrome 4 protein